MGIVDFLSMVPEICMVLGQFENILTPMSGVFCFLHLRCRKAGSSCRKADAVVEYGRQSPIEVLAAVRDLGKQFELARLKKLSDLEPMSLPQGSGRGESE